jgi:hypothetical protein
MNKICELVQQALNTGYLDLEAEKQLRQLLVAKYDKEDLKFFMKLQLAAMNGEVTLESHEQRQSKLSFSVRKSYIQLFKHFLKTKLIFSHLSSERNNLFVKLSD